MKKLLFIFVLAVSAAFAGTVQLGTLKDTDAVVTAPEGSATITGDSISLRNSGSESGLDIVGSGERVVVTNGTTVYEFPERSGTVMLQGDEVDPTTGVTNNVIYIRGKTVYPWAQSSTAPDTTEHDPSTGLTNGTIYVRGAKVYPWAQEENAPESGKIDDIYTNGVKVTLSSKAAYLIIPTVADLEPVIAEKVNTYKDLHYDATLEVTWTNVYDNGHVYMVTVTNTNVSVAQ